MGRFLSFYRHWGSRLPVSTTELPSLPSRLVPIDLTDQKRSRLRCLKYDAICRQNVSISTLVLSRRESLQLHEHFVDQDVLQAVFFVGNCIKHQQELTLKISTISYHINVLLQFKKGMRTCISSHRLLHLLTISNCLSWPRKVYSFGGLLKSR